MPETKYGKYIRIKPLVMPETMNLAAHPNFDPTGGAPERPGSGVYLSGDAFPGCPIYVSLQRTSQVPKQNPFVEAHKHDDADEIILFVSTGPDAELGTNVTFAMGAEGEKHTFHETAVIYVPKGIIHCPIWYSEFKPGKEFYLIAYLMQPDYPTA